MTGRNRKSGLAQIEPPFANILKKAFGGQVCCAARDRARQVTAVNDTHPMREPVMRKRTSLVLMGGLVLCGLLPAQAQTASALPEALRKFVAVGNAPAADSSLPAVPASESNAGPTQAIGPRNPLRRRSYSQSLESAKKTSRS